MPAEAVELTKAAPSELLERSITPAELRRALEAWARIAAEDRELVLHSFRQGYVEHLDESVRIVPTGQTDGDDRAPVFASVGATEAPDAVLGPMVGQAFVVRHRAIVAPVLGSTLSLPAREIPALPPGEASESSTKEEEE